MEMAVCHCIGSKILPSSKIFVIRAFAILAGASFWMAVVGTRAAKAGAKAGFVITVPAV
jgi:hypothetical protein